VARQTIHPEEEGTPGPHDEQASVLPPGFAWGDVPPDCRTDLIEQHWQWLAGSQDHPDWPVVWLGLMALPDLPRARRRELICLGWYWQPGHEDHPQWPAVWCQLIVVPNFKPQPRRDLVVRGLQWVSGNEDHPEWPAVWSKLARLPDVPEISIQHRDDLAQRGLRWIAQRDDHGQWSLVWRTLVSLQSLLRESCDDVLLRGCDWLSGRDECDGWSVVWIALQDAPDLPPERRAVVVAQGYRWLPGREERVHWPRIWRRLLQQPDLPPDYRRELLRLGWQWLSINEERPQWSRLWQALLTCPDLPPHHRQSLLEQGWQWLQAHPHHDAWTFVWTTLMQAEALLPEVRAELAALGIAWVSADRNRGQREWPEVWQVLRHQRMLAGAQDEALLSLGRDWLLHEGRRSNGWPDCYLPCLRHRLRDADLLEAGLAWYRQHGKHEQAAVVLEAVLRATPLLTPDTPVVTAAVGFLNRHWTHPRWRALWLLLFERGLRPQAETLAFKLGRGRPNDPHTLFVVDKVSRFVDPPTAHRLAALAVAYPWSSAGPACLLRAYPHVADDPEFIRLCLEWLQAFPGPKAQGWIRLFCRLAPQHQTHQTIPLAFSLISLHPVLRAPDCLLYLTQLWKLLDPTQRTALRASVQASVENPERLPHEAWTDLARFLTDTAPEEQT